MRKQLTLILILALTLAAAPMAAADSDALVKELFASELEAFLGPGVTLDNATVNLKKDGISSISIPIPEEKMAAFRAQAASSGAKDFATMATGMSLSEPSSFSALISAVSSQLLTDYNVWCVIANLRDTDQTKNITIQMKGEAKVTDSVTIAAATFHVFWINATTPGFKIVTLQCKIGGGGKIKSKTLPNL